MTAKHLFSGVSGSMLGGTATQPLHPAVGEYDLVQKQYTKKKTNNIYAACVSPSANHVIAVGSTSDKLFVFATNNGIVEGGIPQPRMTPAVVPEVEIPFDKNATKSVETMCFSADGRHLVIGGGGNKKARVALFAWDAAQGRLTFERMSADRDGKVNAVACAPGPNHLIACGGTRAGTEPDKGKGEIVFYEAARMDEKEVCRVSRPDSVNTVAFSLRHNRLLFIAGGKDQLLALYVVSGQMAGHPHGRETHHAAHFVVQRSKPTDPNDTSHTRAVKKDYTRGRKASVHATLVLDNAQSQPDLVCELKRSADVTCACFSPNGEMLLVGTQDKKAAMYDVVTGSLLLEVDFVGGKNDTLNTISFSPSGKNFCIGGGGKKSGQLAIYDAGTGTMRRVVRRNGRVRTLQWADAPVASSADTRNFSILAAGGDDGCLSIYDMHKNPYSLFPVVRRNGEMTHICISPDGSKLLVGGNNFINNQKQGHVAIYDLGPGSSIDPIFENSTACGKDVLGCAFSPDSEDIAVVGSDNTIKLGFGFGKKEKGTFEKFPVVATFHKDVKYLDTVCFAPKAVGGKKRQIVVAGGSHKELNYFDVKQDPPTLVEILTPGFIDDKTKREYDRVKISNPVTIIEYTPDGQLLGLGGGDMSSNESEFVVFEEVPTNGAKESAGKVTLRICGQKMVIPGKPIRALCFSPDKKVLAVGGESNSLMLYMLTRDGGGVTGPIPRCEIALGRCIRDMVFVSDPSFEDSPLILAVGGGGSLTLHDLSEIENKRIEVPRGAYRTLPVDGDLCNLGFYSRKKNDKTGGPPILALSVQSSRPSQTRSSKLLLWLDGIPHPNNELSTDPPWPPFDYVMNQNIFSDEEIENMLERCSEEQRKAIVVTCSNQTGASLLERAIRKDRRRLAMSIIKWGGREAVLSIGRVEMLDGAQPRLFNILKDAMHNKDDLLLSGIIRAVSTDKLFGARNLIALEAISSALPQMANNGMAAAVQASLELGTFAGGGFVLTDPDAPPVYGSIVNTEIQGNPFPLPVKLDFNSQDGVPEGRSIWSWPTPFIIQGLRFRTESGAPPEERDQEQDNEDDSDDSFHEDRGSAMVEVVRYRVTLPHLGNVVTLNALLNMGPEYVRFFGTSAMVTTVNAHWKQVKTKFYHEVRWFCSWMAFFVLFVEVISRFGDEQGVFFSVIPFWLMHLVAAAGTFFGLLRFTYYELQQAGFDKQYIDLTRPVRTSSESSVAGQLGALLQQVLGFLTGGANEHSGWNKLQHVALFGVATILLLDGVLIAAFGTTNEPDCDEDDDSCISDRERFKTGHKFLRIITAITCFLMLGGSFHYIRGFDSSAHIVRIFSQTVVDMGSFLSLLLLIIFGFSITFRVLYSGLSEASIEDMQDGSGYETFDSALFSTFVAGFLGDFNTDPIEALGEGGGSGKFVESIIARSMFGIFMTLVMVVALNAMIAFMGESFNKVNGIRGAEMCRQRAALLVEYLTLFDKETYERDMAWVHLLAPASLIDDASSAFDMEDALSQLTQRQREHAASHAAEIKNLKFDMDELSASVGTLSSKIDTLLTATPGCSVDVVSNFAH